MSESKFARNTGLAMGALLASSATLVCCVLPAVLVAIGAGAALAGLKSPPCRNSSGSVSTNRWSLALRVPCWRSAASPSGLGGAPLVPRIPN